MGGEFVERDESGRILSVLVVLVHQVGWLAVRLRLSRLAELELDGGQAAWPSRGVLRLDLVLLLQPPEDSHRPV